jgi:hypothetical protein
MHNVNRDTTDLVLRAKNAVKAFVGTIVDGVVIDRSADGSEIVHVMRAHYGCSDSSGGLRPMSIERLVDNPGEPHVDDPKLVIEALVRRDGILGHFERGLIAGTTSRFRMNHMFMEAGSYIKDEFRVYQLFHFSTHLGVTGDENDDDLLMGQQDYFGHVRMVELGDEVAFGMKAKRVRVSLTNFMDLWYEGVVIPEPNFQVATGDKFLEGNHSIFLRRYLGRTVKQMKVIDNRLIPVEVEYQFNEHVYTVKVESITELPKDYNGLWEWNNPTGTAFGGPGETATRKYCRERIVDDETNSILPYTTEETQKIEAYLGKLRPNSDFRLRWIILFNILIVSTLYFLFRRRNTIAKSTSKSIDEVEKR